MYLSIFWSLVTWIKVTTHNHCVDYGLLSAESWVEGHNVKQSIAASVVVITAICGVTSCDKVHEVEMIPFAFQWMLIHQRTSHIIQIWLRIILPHSHSQQSGLKLVPLKFGMDEQFNPKLYWACTYLGILSMLAEGASFRRTCHG